MPTSYVRDMMEGIGADSLDGDLRQLADDDAVFLEGLGVSDERERNLAFYLDHFLDDFRDEMGLPPPADRVKILSAAFSELRDRPDVDLTDIRGALYRAMGGWTKRAHPNVSGVMETNMKPTRDVAKWVGALGELHAAMRGGDMRQDALRHLMEDWDPVEKFDFQQWLRYYEHGDHEKYAMVVVAEEAPVQPPAQPAPPAQQPAPRRGRPKAETRTLADNQKALIGRLDAAKRLLRLFKPPVWPQERWNSVYRALSELEQEIVSLRTTASMRDRIIRTAGIWTRAGFSDGADMLLRIAQPPDEDVATQIEKALTGREYETKPSEAPAGPPVGMGEMPPPLPPPPEAGAGAPPEGMPPEAAAPLPEPPPPPPAPEPEKTKPGKDENPYEGATAQDVLEILEPLMKHFKERETVRKLSKVDMMMDALNIVSYFPELGEAVARLIETDSYVGGRIEKIIGKLRGGMREGGKNEKEEKPQAPNIEMGPPEETGAAVTEAPPPAEEKAAEVGEQPPPAAPSAAAPGA